MWRHKKGETEFWLTAQAMLHSMNTAIIFSNDSCSLEHASQWVSLFIVCQDLRTTQRSPYYRRLAERRRFAKKTSELQSKLKSKTFRTWREAAELVYWLRNLNLVRQRFRIQEQLRNWIAYPDQMQRKGTLISEEGLAKAHEQINTHRQVGKIWSQQSIQAKNNRANSIPPTNGWADDGTLGGREYPRSFRFGVGETVEVDLEEELRRLLERKVQSAPERQTRQKRWSV